jgi:hypothetical protein
MDNTQNINVGDLVIVRGCELAEVINRHTAGPRGPRVEARFLDGSRTVWFDANSTNLTPATVRHTNSQVPEAGQRVAFLYHGRWSVGTMVDQIRQVQAGLSGFYVNDVPGDALKYTDTWAPLPIGTTTPHFDIVTETGTTNQISLKNTATGKYVGMLQPGHERGIIAALTRYVEEQDTEREAAERAAWLDDALKVYMGSVELDRSAVKERLARLYDAGYRKPTP